MTNAIGLVVIGYVWGIITVVIWRQATDADTQYENTERNPRIVPAVPNSVSTLRTVDTTEARKNAKRMYALAVQERVDLVTQVELSVEAQRVSSCGCYTEEAA